MVGVIGFLVLGVMWGTAHIQLLMGSQSLALRYLVTLGVGYLGYLLMLRLWAGAMVGRDDASTRPPRDIPVPTGRSNLHHAAASRCSSRAEAAISVVAVRPQTSRGERRRRCLAQGSNWGAGGGRWSRRGRDRRGAGRRHIPGRVAVLFGAGSLLLLYFRWEALLTVAVELAFSWVSARTAIRVVREGWLSAAVRLTWKPLLGAVFCAVLLGATIDYFIPAAHSLPHALTLMKASRH